MTAARETGAGLLDRDVRRHAAPAVPTGTGTAAWMYGAHAAAGVRAPTGALAAVHHWWVPTEEAHRATEFGQEHRSHHDRTPRWFGLPRRRTAAQRARLSTGNRTHDQRGETLPTS